MNEDKIRKLSQCEQSQEFLLNSPSPNSQLTPHLLEKYTKFHQFEYFTLFKVLARPHALRSHNELKFLSDFARKNLILKELTQINGSEYSRGLLRSASLEEYEAGSLVQQKGSEIKKIYIILQGKLGAIKNVDQSDMIQQMSLRKTYEILTQLARREIKRFSKLARKLSSWRDNFQRHTQQLEGQENVEYLEYYERHQTFADKVRCASQIHTHKTVALQPSLLLTVDIKNIMYWLNHCFQTKLQVSFQLLRQHPCFSCLSDEILQSVIGYLVVIKASKGEVVYQQGSQSDKIYFLQEGELKIQKTSKLFIQNPNSLYVDRRKLMNEHEISNKEYLPYADFHLLYNYRPTYKNIEIGILNPFCIFGQQEIIQSRLRQTTVRCVALKNTYFSIELKKLQQTLGQNYKLFMKGIADSVKEKVKYRQNAFATTINISNKKELKYFFEGDSPGLKNQKKTIDKINQKIKLQTLETLQKLQNKHEAHQQSPRERISQAIKSERHSLQKQQVIPPSFNSFNFHKMLKTRLKKPSLEQSSSGEEQSTTLEFGPLKEELNRQKRIINNSHTWRIIKAKVNKEKQLCHKIGSYKYKIDFSSPLIDEKHFQKIETEMKRIQRDKKVKIYNFSTLKQRSSSRINNRSLNTIRSQR